jgi:cytochrome c biogenesis protein CcdA
MGDLPLALAVAAGSVAALNPCGFAMLPVYLSFLVIGDRRRSRGAAVVRALGSAAAITMGFAVVFALFGLAVTPVADATQRYAPWFTVVLGLVLVGLGGWLLAGRDVPGLAGWRRRGPAVTGSMMSMVAFGAAYALASLGCAVGPFLAIVASSFRAGSVPAGLALFAAYAAGMGLVVLVVALLVALARTGLVDRLRRGAPAVSRAAGAIMLIAGGYVSYYGWYELRLRHGAPVADPVVETAGTLQRWLAAGVDRLGPIGLTVVVIVLLAGVTSWSWWTRRISAAPPTTAPHADTGTAE